MIVITTLLLLILLTQTMVAYALSSLAPSYLLLLLWLPISRFGLYLQRFPPPLSCLLLSCGSCFFAVSRSVSEDPSSFFLGFLLIVHSFIPRFLTLSCVSFSSLGFWVFQHIARFYEPLYSFLVFCLSWLFCLVKFIAPSIDDIPAKCKLNIPRSTAPPEWYSILAIGG